MHPVLAGQNHAQRAVGVDDVDTLDGDLAGFLRSLAEGRGGQHDQDQRRGNGVTPEK